jgi:dihydroorotase
VLFDVGHGAGSFSWQTCEIALAQEFLPDTISTDLHTRNVHGPVYDLATTVSKFLHLGLSLDEALRKVTAVPARVLGDAALVDIGGDAQAAGSGARIGTLAVGAWGDAVVLELQEGAYDLVDCHKQVRRAGQVLVPRLVVAGGRIYEGSGAPVMHAH